MTISAIIAQNAQALNNLASTQLAFRNRIINGACNIVQRVNISCTTGIGGYGAPDRYYAYNGSSGGEFTQSQGTITYNGIVHNAVVQTVNTAIASTTGTNYWDGITQKIEGYNCHDLLGQPVTVSFIFNTNVSGTYSVSICDGAYANTIVAIFTAIANTPVKVIIPIPILPLTLTIPNTNALGLQVNIGAINTGTFQTAVTGIWQTGDYIMATGATNWGSTAGNFIALTNLQLEAGTSATPFENTGPAIEMIRCQRYYQTLQFFQTLYGTSGAAIEIPFNFTTMRAVPTVVAISPSYANASGFNVLYAGLSDFITTFTVSSTGMATVNTSGTLSAEL
jgi:hypothetical protein